MTDREKAFVLNGMRNYMKGASVNLGFDSDSVDPWLWRAAKLLGVNPELLEETRADQQRFVEEVQALSNLKITYGD
jgi:hypothetical protein